MQSLLRTVLSVIAGMVAGTVVILVVDVIGDVVAPLAPGVKPGDEEALKAAMPNAQVGPLLIVLFGWALGSFVAGWVASRLDPPRQIWPGVCAGGWLMLAGMLSLLKLPHPLWFSILGALVFVPFALLGARLASLPAGSLDTPLVTTDES